MMTKTYFAAIAAVAVALPMTLTAAEGDLPFEISNRLRVEMDDNVRQSSTDADDSLKIIEEIEFIYNLDLQNSFIGFRYQPSLVWWDDRDEDDVDVHHQFEGIFQQDFSPRTSLSIRDTFRLSELPELVEEEVMVRDDNDYIYNSLNASLNHEITPDKTSIRADARYALLAYDDQATADRQDYDQYTGGLEAMHRLNPGLSLGGQARYSQYEYDNDLRDSDSVQVGISVEKNFSPTLQGTARAGWEHRESDGAAEDSLDQPYGNVGATFTPAAGTRVNIGAGYAIAPGRLSAFAYQRKISGYAGVSHDLTARLAVHLNGSVSQGDYDAEDAVVEEVTGGDETVTRVSARATYKLNHNNWLEAGLQHTDFESDVGVEAARDYDRNRINVGWKTRI